MGLVDIALEDPPGTPIALVDTRARVKASLRPLERFPRLGPELSGRYSGQRFLLGPWRWLLLVYSFDQANDRVTVVSVQDARSSGAATGTR